MTLLTSEGRVTFSAIPFFDGEPRLLSELIDEHLDRSPHVTLVATPRFWQALVLTEGKFVGPTGVVDLPDAFDVRILTSGGEIRWLAAPSSQRPLLGRAARVTLAEETSTTTAAHRVLDRGYRCWGSTTGRSESPTGPDLGPFSFHEVRADRVGSVWLPVATRESTPARSITLNAREIVAIDPTTGLATVIDEVAIDFSLDRTGVHSHD